MTHGGGGGGLEQEEEEGTICALLQGHVESEKRDLSRKESWRTVREWKNCAAGWFYNDGGEKRGVKDLKRQKGGKIRTVTAKAQSGIK